MIGALQTLHDNGISTNIFRDVLVDLIDNDNVDDVDELRRLVALDWYIGEGNNCDPDDCVLENDETVHIAPGDYRVLTNDEADADCAEYITESLWLFNADFLADETGIDKIVFEALAGKCEGANDAVRSIIDGSCGIAEFVDSAVSADGRGHFLSHYDGEEIEGRNDWYLYRVN